MADGYNRRWGDALILYFKRRKEQTRNTPENSPQKIRQWQWISTEKTGLKKRGRP
jgi:hypothetical protein